MMHDINYRIDDGAYVRLVQGKDDWFVVVLVEGELVSDHALSEVTANPRILPFPDAQRCQEIADWAFDAWGVAVDMDVREAAYRCWDGESDRAWIPS